MLALPRLVASGVAAADDADEGRACYYVAAACVSLVLFIVLAAAVSIARAAAITGGVVLLLGLVGWLAPTGTGSGRTAPAAAPAPVPDVRLVVHHRCACGLSDAAIGALPAFAYQPAPAEKKGAGGVSGGSSVLCAVCLDDVRPGEMLRRLPACSHLFHADCVDAWLRAHRTCPLCRCELYPWDDVAAATASSTDDALPPV